MLITNLILTHLNKAKNGLKFLKVYYLRKKYHLVVNFLELKTLSLSQFFIKIESQIISAAFSSAGRIFAIKNCDILVTMFSDIAALKHQVQIIKRQAKTIKKNFKCLLCAISYAKKLITRQLSITMNIQKKTLTKLQYKTFKYHCKKS